MNTRRFSRLRNRRLQSLAIALGLSASLLTMGNALALDGTVTVTATNTTRLSLTIQDNSAAFGAGIGPDGTGTGGEISSVLGTSGNEGAYYIWSPSSTPNITVKSNKTWTGTVLASENNGVGASSTITIASGALRYGTALPGTYAAAAGGTAFTDSAVSPSGWLNQPRGVSTFHYYYFLRVDWDDEIGGFNSTVTYSVTN
jgi:hypothetical protein